MQRYLMQRLAIMVPTLIGITILIFLAMRVLPGDPLASIVTESSGTYVFSEEELADLRASLGLDRPLPLQYLDWMGDVLSGNLGTSFWTNEPIRDLILRRGPITAQIALMAVFFSWLIGVPLGMLSALWRNTPFDHVSRLVMTVFIAVPSFWIGLLIILATVLIFTWRPPLTIVQFWENPGVNLSMTSLPALALGLGLAASTARMARSATLEVMFEDYIRTARAKGLSTGGVMLGHVFKNAMLPVLTTSGLALGGLLGGAVSVERAFGVPGLGTLLVQALTERDWMMIQNLVLLYGVIFAVINLLVDISYGFFDPRIRYE
jgi:peptide/nickel transport system permease protein